MLFLHFLCSIKQLDLVKIVIIKKTLKAGIMGQSKYYSSPKDHLSSSVFTLFIFY